MMKQFLMAGSATIALVLAVPAAAQDTPAPTASDTAADDATQPGDIVVTAQKRSERLQDVPLAVSVVTGDTLTAQGNASLEGAVNLVPSFNFLKSGTTLNQSLFLRGVGTATFSIAGEPSVSTVVDGVVYSRSGEAFSELVDVDRIEVLRGPQGTLFGKNASAGVINIVSKQPTSDFGGYVDLGYLSDSEYRGRAAINVPLGDSIRTRLTGFYDNYDGNIRNVAVNKTVNGWEHYGARLQIAADVGSNLKLNFAADWHHNNDDCCAEVIATGTPVVVANTVRGFTTTSPVFSALPTPRGADTRTINQNLITSTIETGYGFSLQGDLTLGEHTITSITSYRNWKNTEIRDGDWLDQAYIGFGQLHDFGPQTGHTVTQEVRLTSPANRPFSYVVGLFYSNAVSERIFGRSDQTCTAVGAAPATLTPCSSPLANPSTFPTGVADFGSTFDNLAFFGQGTWKLTPTFRLIGGLRYSIDHLDVFHSRVSPITGPGIQPNFDQGVYNQYLVLVAGGMRPDLAAAAAVSASNGVPFRTGTSSRNLSGKVGWQLDLSHESTLYFTYARGYKGPAYNVFFNLTSTGTNVIAPETSNAFELGLKNTLANGRLTFNIAAFYAKYYNFQANNPDSVAGVVVTRFTNAGKVSTRGIEVDARFAASHDLVFSGGLAYTDAHVDQFNAAPGAAATAIIPRGTPLGFAPRFKGNLQVDYTIRSLSSFNIQLGASGSYQTSQLALFAPDPVQRALGTIPGYGLLNLSAGISTKDDKYKLTVSVRNLLDQSFAAAISNGGPAGSYRYQIPREADRYVSVTLHANF